MYSFHTIVILIQVMAVKKQTWLDVCAAKCTPPALGILLIFQKKWLVRGGWRTADAWPLRGRSGRKRAVWRQERARDLVCDHSHQCHLYHLLLYKWYLSHVQRPGVKDLALDSISRSLLTEEERMRMLVCFYLEIPEFLHAKGNGSKPWQHSNRAYLHQFRELVHSQLHIWRGHQSYLFISNVCPPVCGFQKKEKNIYFFRKEKYGSCNVNTALIILIVPLMLSPLCQLFLVRPGVSMVNLCDFYFYEEFRSISFNF